MKEHLKRQIELHEKISDGYDKRYSTSYSVLYAIKRNEYLISLFKEQEIKVPINTDVSIIVFILCIFSFSIYLNRHAICLFGCKLLRTDNIKAVLIAFI